MKIGFIGAGNMGSALARAAAKSEGTEIYVCDLDMAKCLVLKEEIGAVCSTANEIAEICDFIFLAVKPKFAVSALFEMKPVLEKRDGFTVISMAAGVTLSSLDAVSDERFPIIRIMPNTPVSVGKGIILASGNRAVTEKTLLDFKKALSPAGDIKLIDEALIDAGTALSGCSPAFVYMFIEALADGAVEAGLPRDLAQECAAKTLIGAATLLLESGRHPGELKDAVCSPGGSTIEGVHALEDGGLRSTVSSAVIRAYEKTKKLGK